MPDQKVTEERKGAFLSHMMAGKARPQEWKLVTLCLQSGKRKRDEYQCSARLVFFILSGTPTNRMVLSTFQADLLSSVKFYKYPLTDMARSLAHQ